MKVYEKVRAYIHDHGIKQIMVAKRAGIPNNTFNAILNGKRTLYADDLKAICLALNVSPEAFIDICIDEEELKSDKKERMGTMAKKPYETCEKELDISHAIMCLQEKPEELENYAWIMEQVGKTDVSADVLFQRKFNHFCRIRRNAEQRKAYYDLFESCKTRPEVDFSYIIRTLYEKTGWVEASFSSKMLAALHPDMPIWDSIVRKHLGLKDITTDDKAKKLCLCEEQYEKIIAWYRDFLATEKAKEAVAAFDTAFPQHSGFSMTKKIDFLLWGSGEE